MAIFKCASCGLEKQVPDKYSDRDARCPGCKGRGKVRSDPSHPPVERVKFRCPECGQKMAVPREHSGKRVRCVKCRAIATVPPESIVEAVSVPPDEATATATALDQAETAENLVGGMNDLLAMERQTATAARPTTKEEEPPPLPGEAMSQAAQLGNAAKRRRIAGVVMASVLWLFFVAVGGIVAVRFTATRTTPEMMQQAQEAAEQFLAYLSQGDVAAAEMLLAYELHAEALAAEIERHEEQLERRHQADPRLRLDYGPITEARRKMAVLPELSEMLASWGTFSLAESRGTHMGSTDGYGFIHLFDPEADRSERIAILSEMVADELFIHGVIVTRPDEKWAAGAETEFLYELATDRMVPIVFVSTFSVPIRILNALGTGVLFVLLVYVIIALLFVYCLCDIFVKADEPLWAVFIPVANAWFFARLGGRSGWMGIAMLACIAAIFFVPAVIPVAIFLALLIVISVGIARAFGRGWLFGVGLALAPMIYYPVLSLTGDAY